MITKIFGAFGNTDFSQALIVLHFSFTVIYITFVALCIIFFSILYSYWDLLLEHFTLSNYFCMSLSLGNRSFPFLFLSEHLYLWIKCWSLVNSIVLTLVPRTTIQVTCYWHTTSILFVSIKCFAILTVINDFVSFFTFTGGQWSLLGWAFWGH